MKSYKLVFSLVIILLSSFLVKACYLNESQLNIININVINKIKSSNVLSEFKLAHRKVEPLGYIYIFENFEYNLEVLDVLGEKRKFHYFQNNDYELLLTEHVLSNDKYFTDYFEKKIYSFNIIKEAIVHLSDNDFDKCTELSFQYYLAYTSYFPNQSAKKIDFYMTNKSIFAIYDNDFTSMLFLIQSSNNPQKLIRGSITKKE